MGPLAVVLVDTGGEARLLLEDVGRGGLGRLAFEREMHPFVAAVLLRTAGLRPLEVDAQPEPPDGELAEAIERMARGEGHAVIGSDRVREPEVLERALEDDEGEFLLRR